MRHDDFALKDIEAMLLALIARGRPITAHRINKTYEDSPVSNFNASAASHPADARLGFFLRYMK